VHSALLAVQPGDLIVVDECHRGYNLDREMSDAELRRGCPVRGGAGS